jgi:hypothetical protein
MHFANLMIDASVEEDTFGRRRLPSVDVRRDADVAIPFDGSLACHDGEPGVP